MPFNIKESPIFIDAMCVLDFSEESKVYLKKCAIKDILVSQAEKAWEISFICPESSNEAIEDCARKLFEYIFGSLFSYKFIFQSTYDSVKIDSICGEHKEYLLDQLSSAFPICRTWMKNARFSVKGNCLQLYINQEIGWQYMISRNFSRYLEEIINKKYDLTVNVELLLNEDNHDDPADNESYLDEILETRIDEYAKTEENKSEGQKKHKSKISVIHGKKINVKPVSIQEIVEEEKDITIKGFLFNKEVRLLKTGRKIINFSLSDKTDSISCKLIIDSKRSEAIEKRIQEKSWYLIRGQVSVDSYSQELTMIPRDICEAYHEQRVDAATNKRIELHMHTKMSALDGLADIDEIIKRTSIWGHEAIAITDHGVVQAFPEAYEAGKRYKVKIIYGLEAYIFNDDHDSEMHHAKAQTYHCIILAQTKEGLRNLYELVTLSHLKYFYRVPRIPKSTLARLRKGLLLGSACESGELIQGYINGIDKRSLEQIASFYDFLEIQPRGNNKFLLDNGTFTSEQSLLDMNKSIYGMAKELDKRIVATGDVHFIDPEDEVYRRILMAGKGFEDSDDQAPLYFKNTQEMLEEFAYLGLDEAQEVVIGNPKYICDLIEELIPIPSDFYPPEIPGAEKEIEYLTMQEAKKLYGDPLPKLVSDRIRKELDAIINNGFAVLYLTAHKLVRKSNEDGYLVGSRGSVGSSLVATLCGITEVNPLSPHYRCPNCSESEFINDINVRSGFDLPNKVCQRCNTEMIKDGHNILFEVFMGFKGDKVPDIDLNFSGEYQPKAHKYTEEIFGKENVFRAGTIATIAQKTAFGFVKNYFEERKKSLRNPEINRLLAGCTGVKRTTGQHPGGLMVLPKGLDVHLFTPLQRPADDLKTDTITTHFDYHAISSRLVKLDILGHDDPTVLKMLEDLTGVNCRAINLDDPKVFSLFRSTEILGIDPKELGSRMGTLGIPEFGTKFVRQMLEDTKPQTFSDLIMISGFSHGTDVWLHNAQDLIRNKIAEVSEVISTRDDIMLYLTKKGIKPDKAFKIMEDVRKGNGIRSEFIDLLEDHQVPDWYIRSCQKIKYMFPKAHAAAYVIMALRIAYFKIHYPAAFYASFFSVRADEFDSEIIVGGIKAIKNKMEYIDKKGGESTQTEDKLYTILEVSLEMFLRGIRLKHVDLNNSDAKCFKIDEGGKALLPPLVSLPGLGQNAAMSIVNARSKKPFTSQDDLRTRAKLTKTVIEVLNNHGCLSTLPQSDQITLF